MDLKFYRLTEDEGNRRITLENLVPKDRQPPKDSACLMCEVELAPGVTLFGWAWGDNVFISDGSQMLWAHSIAEKAEPFFEAEVQGNAFHRTKKVEAKSRRSMGWNPHGQGDVAGPIIEVPEDYDHYYDYGVDHYQTTGTYVRGTPWGFLNVKITCKDVSEVMTFRFKRPDAGVAVVPESGQEIACHNDFFGLRWEWTETIINIERGNHYAYYNRSNSGLHTLWRLLTRYEVSDKQALWARYLEGVVASGGLQKIDDKGVKGIEGRKGIKENLARLEAEEPVLWRFWLWLHNGKVRNGMSNNSLLAAFLKEHGKDYDALVAGLRQAMDVGPDSDIKEPPGYYYPGDRDDNPMTLRTWCTRLPGAGEERRERLAKKDWTLRKGLANQAEGLGVTKELYPKLFAAIEGKQIPLSVFHQPGNKNQPVNIEFDLWEKALKQPGWAEPLFEIAQDAGRRSTYEKDITPYIAFLFHLPKYLDRHTEGRKKWRAVPKYVSSEWELEMDDEAQGGTTKRRSALTPVADNEERVITVPYAAMAIHGISTTYCYSLRYHVLEENMIDPESGTPVVNELERKLNGRDDYGLMFYTLTGTARNRGYPAFLIIFERLKAGTRVHFHRVHPCRSKNGVVTPASKLIEEGYRYMAGNIRAEEIHAQQGDLIFIKNETQQLDWANEGQPVAEFESHAFVPTNGKPILLIENTAKSIKNRLGFLHCDEPFLVDHPEHEPLEDMPAGTYEVRRCKSWEANPKAVWTLTID